MQLEADVCHRGLDMAAPEVSRICPGFAWDLFSHETQNFKIWQEAFVASQKEDLRRREHEDDPGFV